MGKEKFIEGAYFSIVSIESVLHTLKVYFYKKPAIDFEKSVQTSTTNLYRMKSFARL